MEIECLEDLKQVTLDVKILKQGMSVHLYFIDGLLIDTGPSIKQKELVKLYNQWDIRSVILTHHHEDHSGTAYWLQKNKHIPIYMHENGLDICSKNIRVPFYRRGLLGKRPPFQAKAINNFFETERYTWDIIHTPGHADDHISLYNREKGWLFGGDLYVTPTPKSIFFFESIPQIIKSLKKILTYDFDTYLCAHAGIIKQGNVKIEKKLHYLEEIQGEVLYLHEKGFSPRQIRKQMFPKGHPMNYFTLFDHSPQHLVNSIIG